MPKIIAVCNQKGGVGKTTTTLNVGTSIALQGEKVLLVDLDPQANATGGLGIEKKKVVAQSIYQVLLEGLPVEKTILETKVSGLSLIPAHVSLSGAEVELVGLSRREGLLKGVLEPIRTSYDLILIDCPPSVGLLTINAMTAADSILIPLQCEYYALEGLSQLLGTIRLVQDALNPALSVEGIVLTMADFRTKLTHDVIQEVRQFFGSAVYDVVIPRSVRLSEAPSHGVPIALYDSESPGAKAYQLLAQKIREKLDVRNSRIRQGNPGTDSGERSHLAGAIGEPSSEQGRDNEDSDPINPAEPVSAAPGPG